MESCIENLLTHPLKQNIIQFPDQIHGYFARIGSNSESIDQTIDYERVKLSRLLLNYAFSAQYFKTMNLEST